MDGLQIFRMSLPFEFVLLRQENDIHLYGPRQAILVLIAYASSESRGTVRQKARSLAPLNGWACAVKICHVGMLEGTSSLDGAHITVCFAVMSSCARDPLRKVHQCQFNATI